MPRETIYGDSTVDARIAWGREDGVVQLSTNAQDGAERVIGMVNEWLTAAKMPTIDLDQLQAALSVERRVPGMANALPSALFFDGFYTQLRRPQVNKMIQVLRRARDQAFGRDE